MQSSIFFSFFFLLLTFHVLFFQTCCIFLSESTSSWIMYCNILNVLVTLFLVKSGEFRPRRYKTFFMLDSVEHEILNAHKYKNIKKFGFFRLR